MIRWTRVRDGQPKAEATLLARATRTRNTSGVGQRTEQEQLPLFGETVDKERGECSTYNNNGEKRRIKEAHV